MVALLWVAVCRIPMRGPWSQRRIAMSMCEAGTSFSEIGRTLGVEYMTVGKSVSYLSAISHSGLLRFMVLNKAVDAPTLIRKCGPGSRRTQTRARFTTCRRMHESSTPTSL